MIIIANWKSRIQNKHRQHKKIQAYYDITNYKERNINLIRKKNKSEISPATKCATNVIN